MSLNNIKYIDKIVKWKAVNSKNKYHILEAEFFNRLNIRPITNFDNSLSVNDWWKDLYYSKSMNLSLKEAIANHDVKNIPKLIVILNKLSENNTKNTLNIYNALLFIRYEYKKRIRALFNDNDVYTSPRYSVVKRNYI